MIKIPLYKPSLDGNERRYVLECLDSTWISSKGRFIRDFESSFARSIGVEHAVAVCNGTIALHLALLALGLGPGQEVIVPTFTFVASVNSISYTGARPVFVDSVPDTWQMDPAEVKKKITPRTRAIMAVHLYGHPCPLDALAEIADENRFRLIEDCAEAFGSKFAGRPVGSFGHIAAFSFFGNKTITTGEGGMVVTNDRALYETASHLKGQGLVAGREYWHDVVGYNYRMTNICAAIGLAQLERCNEFIAKKRQIAEWYKEFLRGAPIVFQKEGKDIVHSYWMVTILAEDQTQRDGLRSFLVQAGIETRPTFFPAHTMPMYLEKNSSYPVAEDLSRRGINLPSWPGLTRDDIRAVSETILKYWKR